jgi:hypothetical protein
MSEPTAVATDLPEPVDVGRLVPYEDITVVLLAGKPRWHALERWVQAWAADPDLVRSPVLLLYRARDRDEMERLVAPLPTVTLVRMPGGAEEVDVEHTHQAYARVFDEIATPWFCLTSIRRDATRSNQLLRDRLAREHDRVRQLELADERAILLHTPGRRRVPARIYVARTLSRWGSQVTPLMRDYLGFLALASGTHKLEGVDLKPATGEIELFARLTTGRMNSELQAPWHYRFALVSPQGEVLCEAPGVLQQRLDNQGGRRWENLWGRLRLDAVPEGNHRIVVGLDTAYPALRSSRSLQPRPGALAPARTVLFSRPGEDEVPVHTRYLVHTVSGTRAWITLQRGTGAEADRRWSRSMLRKDVRQIVKGGAGRRMRAARLVRLLTRPVFASQDIWLIGERADTAQDNGYHLFRHMREHQPERRAYYVIDPQSPQHARVEPLGHVVAHSSWRHRLLMMHATVLANAYSIKHMVPRQWSATSYTRGLAWRVGAQRVYLKHGVHVSPTAVKRGTGGYDLYLSVNARESAALRASSGYRDQVVETGMPRYDTLVPAPSTRTVLFMPTWRRYLVPKLFGGEDEAKVAFEGSAYQQFVVGLLTSPRLHEILCTYDYRLQFLPHYNLSRELAHFQLTSDRTELADTTTHSFQDLIRGCDAFVTDYSSVHFDVAYLGTPIIYTHFDKADYEQGHAVVSWFDHETDGFGPVVHTLEETLDALEDVLRRGCAPDQAFVSRVDAAFTHRDRRNCERAVQAIDQLVEQGQSGSWPH